MPGISLGADRTPLRHNDEKLGFHAQVALAKLLAGLPAADSGSGFLL